MTNVLLAATKEELNEIIQLRYEVLRKPWKKTIETATDLLESSSVNAYIKNSDGQVIACGRLHENENKVGQIRFMAVKESYRGKGLGKEICLRLESEARKKGFVKIQLQARENAVNFYKANGYSIIERSFLMWDIIQHYLMEKTL